MRRLLTACAALMLLLAVGGAAQATSSIEVVTAATFAEKVLQSPLPVVVQFDAKWCPYCRKVQPLLSSLAADRAGKVVVYRIDIDADFGLAQLFSIKSLPTIIVMKNGLETARLEGVPSKTRLYLMADK